MTVADASPSRVHVRSLLAWVAVVCVGFVIAPSPPPPPPMTAEEIAALQRGIDRLVEDTRRWQAQRGDRKLPWTQATGHLAIVVDDVGRELHLMEQLLGLRYEVTFSVLPGAVYAAGAQLRLRADRRRYREILLHLPMEPDDPAQMQDGAEAREDFLRASDSPHELQRKTAAALERVPAAIGVNNHMGSRLTADRAAMDAVMPVLAERGLVFLDSRTTAATVAERAARDAGVPTLARHVFLDDDANEAAIDAALMRAAELARREPTVAIGHPSPELVAVLERRLPQLYDQGIGVYPLSALLGAAERDPTRTPARVQSHDRAPPGASVP